ncbi:MAG: UvrD-helicase domain-containing protein, partial [candidate division WOR-3 bacterium]
MVSRSGLKSEFASVLGKDTELVFPHILIIEASAGAGKTEALAKRYIQLLISEKIRVPHNLPNILAITFTNNAAREMKERILKWLKSLALGISFAEQEEIADLVDLKHFAIQDRARAAVDMIIDNYSDFQIQTIDSFMNQILCSTAPELGMPPENEVTASYENLADLALNALLNEIPGVVDTEEIDHFLNFLNREAKTFPWDPTQSMKKQFLQFLEEEGKVLEEIIFTEQWSVYQEKIEELKRLGEKVLNSKFAQAIRVDAVRELRGNYFDIKKFLNGFTTESLWFDKRKVCPEALELCKGLNKIVEEITELYAISRFHHFGRIYKKFKDFLEQAKRQTETIHFDDINKKLARYLRREIVPEVFYRLGTMLYHFLIDEFQDTDRVQWANMKFLLDEAFAKGGSLFAVGDLKQAIFMFRKADYRIMRRLIRAIEGQSEYEVYQLPGSVRENSRVRRLRNNYRFGSVILNYVDGIFKNKLAKQIGTDFLEADLTCLTTYVQESADRYRPRDRGQGYVKAMVVEKGKDQEPERDVLYGILNDILKRFRPGRVAILTKRNREVERIVEWLSEKSIPTASFSSLDIRKRKIIMEIVNLLQFLDSPIDNLSFATFLAGDIFISAACSYRQPVDRTQILDLIFQWNRDGRDYLYKWLKEKSNIKDLWMLLFEEIFNRVGYLPLYDLASLIFKKFRVFENFQAEAGFLIKFLDAIVNFESNGINDIKGFIKMVGDDNRESSIMSVLLPDYIDAVKVMTFHKAKGLGFPVVINMIYEITDDRDSIYFHKEDGLSAYYILKDFTRVSPKLERIYREKNQ